MIQTKIETNKPFLLLVYNSVDEVLTGDNSFYVNLSDVGDEVSDNNEITIEHDLDMIVIPSTFTIVDNEPQLVTVRLADSLTIEDGAYNFTLKLKNEYSPDVDVVASLVAKTDEEPDEDVYEYKMKYYILRSGYRLNIYENVIQGTVFETIEVNGRVDLTYQDRKDLFEPIIPATLKISLDASLERDFSDLYSEDERTFKVELIRDSLTVFLGFILTADIWEDFVADKWTLNINATDGLSSLKNTSFSNENGLNFFGRMTALQIINICLNKTGLNLGLNTNVQIQYYEWNRYDILTDIYLSTERYFQNDNGTESEPMDCDSVLRSILQIFNASVVQQKGEWYIFRSIDLIEKLLFTHYLNGNFYEIALKQFGHRIGSNINNAEIFHCSGNQKKSISPSVQAYQVSYEYGSSRNVLANGGLILEGISGINIPGWSVFTAPDGLVDRGVRQGYAYGLRSAVRPFSDPWPLMLALNQSIDVKANITVNLNIRFRNDGFNSIYLPFAFGIKNGGTTIWFDIENGVWGNFKLNLVRNAVPFGSLQNNQFTGALDANYNLEVLIPQDGEIVIQIHRDGHGAGGLFGVHGISLSASVNNNIKSKDYIGRRKKRISSAIKSNVTVYNGDSGSDLFVGTIFKMDSDTPTDGWNRYYMYEQGSAWVKSEYPEFKEVLSINAEDNLKISPRPMTIFEGDVKGFIPHLTYFTIDGFQVLENGFMVDKRFQFEKYSYSFDTNTLRMVAREFSSNYFFSDFHEIIPVENFGSESKVTIKG